MCPLTVWCVLPGSLLASPQSQRVPSHVEATQLVPRLKQIFMLSSLKVTQLKKSAYSSWLTTHIGISSK